MKSILGEIWHPESNFIGGDMVPWRQNLEYWGRYGPLNTKNWGKYGPWRGEDMNPEEGGDMSQHPFVNLLFIFFVPQLYHFQIVICQSDLSIFYSFFPPTIVPFWKILLFPQSIYIKLLKPYVTNPYSSKSSKNCAFILYSFFTAKRVFSSNFPPIFEVYALLSLLSLLLN